MQYVIYHLFFKISIIHTSMSSCTIHFHLYIYMFLRDLSILQKRKVVAMTYGKPNPRKIHKASTLRRYTFTNIQLETIRGFLSPWYSASPRVADRGIGLQIWRLYWISSRGQPIRSDNLAWNLACLYCKNIFVQKHHTGLRRRPLGMQYWTSVIHKP
jgi:hypothetical protein